MKAKEAKLLELLRIPQQFSIPIYQRTYSWTECECEQLWNDIVRAGKNTEIHAHFVGSIVYIQESLYQATALPQLLVIDGQQRLTTVTLLLEALARELEKHSDPHYEPVEGFSAIKIRRYYLTNDLEKDEKKYKLILSQNDKETLIALVDHSEAPKEPSVRIMENFKLLSEWIQEAGPDIIPLWRRFFVRLPPPPPFLSTAYGDIKDFVPIYGNGSITVTINGHNNICHAIYVWHSAGCQDKADAPALASVANICAGRSAGTV